MVQNGPNDHFGQNCLIPNRILAFARPKWTILVHLGPPTVLWPFLMIILMTRVDSGSSPSRAPSLYRSKDGSIWQLFVLCLLALGDTVLKCYFYSCLGHPGFPGLERKKFPNGLLPPPAFYYRVDRGSKTFQNLVKNTTLPNRPVFTPSDP